MPELKSKHICPSPRQSNSRLRANSQSRRNRANSFTDYMWYMGRSKKLVRTQT